MAHRSEQSAWHDCPDQIIKDLKQGDSATKLNAWQRVMECKSRDLLEYMRSELEKRQLNPLHAEGMLESLFVRAFTRLATFKGNTITTLYGWLCGFAVNDVRNLSRKVNPREKNPTAPESIEAIKDKYELEDLDAAQALFSTDDALSPETILCQKETLEFVNFIIELSISRLSPVHSVIIRETVLEKNSFKEAALKHSYNPTYLRTEARKAQQKFREEIQVQLNKHKQIYPDRYDDIVKIQRWIDQNGD